MFADLFNFEKTVQVFAYLLKKTGPIRTDSYVRLLKLAYMADRESLNRRGFTITGDRVFAMKNGPVLTRTYDLIRERDTRSREWSRFFTRTRFDLVLTEDPGTGRLSRADMDLLDAVWDQHSDKDQWQLVEITHTFPEWKRHYHEGTSTEIPMDDVVNEVGHAGDLEDLATEAVMNRLFGA